MPSPLRAAPFDSIGAQFLRDVEPGEIVVAEDGRSCEQHPHPLRRQAQLLRL